MARRISSIVAFSVGLVLACTLPAHAIDLETLVMPGPVIEGHADIESECSRCHSPLERKEENRLCLVCHEEVARDLDEKTGLHGRTEGLRSGECRTCHAEHEGRSAPIVVLDVDTFDHAMTDHPLEGAHRRVDCEGCHATGRKHREASSDCASCHQEDDPHRGELGNDCGRCHGDVAWSDARFDHDRTEFPLVARHAEVDCELCHSRGSYESTASGCIDCHASDDAHRGRLGEDCGRCHEPKRWADVRFDHDRRTEFPLRGSHRKTSCASCHRESGAKLGTGCVDCHRPDDVHRGEFGDDCASCHAESRWRDLRFDHARDADYALEGGHADVRCAACHIEPPAVRKVSRRCNDCHAGDDVHQGQMSEECETCHTTESWSRRVTFDHDLVRFPLLGLHAVVACEECHANRAFQDAPTSCHDCHQVRDVHEGRLGSQCATCHNPNGWDLWRFDHDQSTKFPLSGGHRAIACRSCHTQSAKRGMSISSRCESCHAREDPHRGTFGGRCGDCHVDSSWQEVRFGR